MLANRIKPLAQKTTTLFTKSGPECVSVISSGFRRKIWTDVQKQQHEENKKFLAIFPNLVSSISNTKTFKNISDLEEFIKNLLEYNSAGGKKIRGLMTVASYKMLERPENITEESLRMVHTLGWCVELLQTLLLIQDDIMDNALTRRGSICWYRLPDVSMRAINDTTFILGLLFKYLKYNFGDKRYYSTLWDIFNQSILQITAGQHLDSVSARNISRFTEQNYNDIAYFKTVHYTFVLPVSIGLLLANKSSDGAYENDKDLLSKMGRLTLMQNDFMDCFGDEVAYKIGTDIQTGKCTWLAVTALQRCSAAQRVEFEACYGSADPAHVQRVKRLYEELQLPAIYRDAERATYNSVITRIKAIPSDNIVPPALIKKLFNTVYQLRDEFKNKSYTEVHIDN